LRQAPGYIATDVKAEGPEGERYRVRDLWRGHREFEIFRERFSEDFAQFDRRIVDELIEKQEFVGAYYEANDEDKGLG
jgi:hypothetical protein